VTALEPDPLRRNLVVVASAGTGKTHTLIGVLLRLAVGAEADGDRASPLPLSRVVATTFSRKAAAEIRDRLTRELRRLAAEGAASSIAPRASRALDEIAAARVGTLHGLATSIVRSAGLSRGRLLSFDIEGEDEARERARDSAVGALEELLSDNPRGGASLVHLFGGVEPLVERGGELLGRLGEDGRAASDLEVATHDAAQIERTFEEFLAIARLLQEDDVLGPAACAFADAHASSSPALEQAASNLCGVGARGRLSEQAQVFFEFRAGLPGLTHAERGRNLVRLWRLRHRVLPQAELFKSWLVRAEGRLRASMARDSVLGYGDVLREARDILATDTSLFRDLDALLVDEFQDTSRVQREILELMWQDESVDPRLPRIARVRRRGLMVVGDRKQSIYGFRGADVGAFAELCVGLAGRPAREALRIAPGKVWEPEEPIADFLALRENRRSAPKILEFINAYSKVRLHALAEPAELYEIEYAPAIEDLSPPPPAPSLSPTLAAVEGEGSDAARVYWIRAPVGPGITSSRANEAEAIARRVANILATGKPTVRGLPPAPMDIAVLAERNGTLDAVAYALARARIPYVVAGNGFYSTREVKDMVAMLSFIVDPGDVLARASVLRGVWCGVSDQTLIALTDPHRGLSDIAEWDIGERRRLIRAEDGPRLLALRAVVGGLRAATAAIGSAETLRRAVSALELEETLVMLPRGEQRVANVRKILVLAEREPSARAFLTRMDRALDEEQAEPEAATFSETDDAVRLLTIHASKGLDFPIVLLPEAGAAVRSVERSPVAAIMGARSDEPSRIAVRVRDDEGRLHDTPSFAASRRDRSRRDLAERARLAYVAVTRAREAVFFVGDRRAPKAVGSDAHSSTATAALTGLATEERASGLFRIQDMDPPVTPLAPRDEVDAHRASRELVVPPVAEAAALSAEELDDFTVCHRRFQLKHLLALPEPPPLSHAGGGVAKPTSRQLLLFEPTKGEMLAAALAEARWSGFFERAPIDTCRSIRCGYVEFCYPAGSKPRWRSG
jgi:ATP-dependent helicase/nuclease subunit A